MKRADRIAPRCLKCKHFQVFNDNPVCNKAFPCYPYKYSKVDYFEEKK